jgi:hypothetical protein
MLKKLLKGGSFIAIFQELDTDLYKDIIITFF